jgi:hypothetical protein
MQNAEHDIYDEDAFVTILSQVNESSGDAICRPSGIITQASRLV